jgi:hypothetical protein
VLHGRLTFPRNVVRHRRLTTFSASTGLSVYLCPPGFKQEIAIAPRLFLRAKSETCGSSLPSAWRRGV